MAHSSADLRDDVNSARLICTGSPKTFDLRNVTASASHEPEVGHGASRCLPKFPGRHCFSAFRVFDNGSTHRGRRKRSLSPLKKSKVARVKECRACFRCQILRVEVRQCNAIECLSGPNHDDFISVMRSVRVQSAKQGLQVRGTQQSSNGWIALSCHYWSIVSIKKVMLPILSISYDRKLMFADLPAIQPHKFPVFTTLCSMLDEIQLPGDLQAVTNPDALVEDFANWISHSSPGVASSKLALLCTSSFQATAGPILGDSFIKDFRLLIWTTTLSYTAYVADSGSIQQQNKAVCNLNKLRNACGNRVVCN